MGRVTRTQKSRVRKSDAVQEPEPPVQYAETDKEKLEIHKSFLLGIQKDEDGRLLLIETKTAQLFSQTGIIVAILGLFIPLILDKVDVLWLRLVFVAFLSISGFFYLRTIYCAGKNLNIKHFRYPRSKPTTILDPNLKTSNQFLAEEIRDLLYSIPIHTSLNNEKGTNLLKAHRAYVVANILTAILSIAICITVSVSYRKSDTTKVKVEGVVRTEAAQDDSTQTGNGSAETVTNPTPVPASVNTGQSDNANN